MLRRAFFDIKTDLLATKYELLRISLKDEQMGSTLKQRMYQYKEYSN